MPDSAVTVKFAHTHRTTSSLDVLKFPLGGHNYYNCRDMEKLSRRMRWLEISTPAEGTLAEKWEKHYLRRLDHEKRILDGEEGIFSHLNGYIRLKKLKRN